jgi:hypothetical protein
MVRILLRVVSLFVGLFLVSMAILALVEIADQDPPDWRSSNFRVGAPGLFWGIFFIIYAIRGRILGKKSNTDVPG